MSRWQDLQQLAELVRDNISSFLRAQVDTVHKREQEFVEQVREMRLIFQALYCSIFFFFAKFLSNRALRSHFFRV